MAIGLKTVWTLRIAPRHQSTSMPHHRSMPCHRSVYVNNVVNSNVDNTVHVNSTAHVFNCPEFKSDVRFAV
ncbi:hypothetical protein CUMW_215390 [Citrus unshiu]|uniref:Uncharacterized protein n=1 Tax=Citrus unshiu TaxID=55188 RepID=A0A2H5QBW0_CITUN|nr:hypothetical protein CUMW_215390 [Citrus unshiu]